MKLKIIALIFVFISIKTIAQTGPYAKVKFKASSTELLSLISEGIDMEGISKDGEYYIAEFSVEEWAILQKRIKKVEVLVSDMSSFYAERANGASSLSLKNNSIAPPGFYYGSMGSYLTYTEMGEMLDSMHRKYPNLITIKKSIGNSLENNPIYMVKISDNPNIDEPQEKQVLYDAMHHAREPQGMMQLMYYMWYIMDKYTNNDPIAKYILNNRELYFIPIVNPDGYLYNQSINPSGGGMWRKNRSNNANTSRGVDLNRNYGYDWGYDDIGSSPTGSFSTYRGVSAFSEPETQHMRDFVNSKNFKSNLSYHTYGGYLIYPFGARENYYTKDSSLFIQYADSLTKDNAYSYGTVFETLSYFANGGSCDWMYGDTSHNKIISFTPEVGFANDGFWPEPSRIVPLAEENIAPNLFLAKYGVNGLDVIKEDTAISNDFNFSINLSYFSAGLKQNSTIISYLDFYNDSLLRTNLDTLRLSSFGTFDERKFSFALNFNVGFQKYIIPYRIVSLINGEAQYDSAVLVIDPATGITSNLRDKAVKIFPNPSSKSITIDYVFNSNTKANVYNTSGKLLMESNCNTIDISRLASGMYFISIKEGNKIIAIENFRKE